MRLNWVIFALIVAFAVTAVFSFYQVQSGDQVWLRGNFFAAVLTLILAVGILAFALVVYAYKKKKVRTLNMLIAAKASEAAQAGIITGAGLFAIWSGSLLGMFEIYPVVFERTPEDIFAISSAALLVLISSVALWLCKIDIDNSPNSNNYQETRGRAVGDAV
jgi:ABC-type Co2+ transport system permease subunit